MSNCKSGSGIRKTDACGGGGGGQSLDMPCINKCEYT